MSDPIRPSETLLLTINCKVYVLDKGASWVDLYPRGKARVSIYAGNGKARLSALQGSEALISLDILPGTTFAMASESNFFQIDGDEKTDINTYGLSFSTENELNNFHEHIEKAQATAVLALAPKSRGEALYAYNAQAADHLSLKKGDVVENVQHTTAPGWSRGTIGNETGVFPTDYIKEIDAASPPVPEKNDSQANSRATWSGQSPASTGGYQRQMSTKAADIFGVSARDMASNPTAHPRTAQRPSTTSSITKTPPARSPRVGDGNSHGQNPAENRTSISSKKTESQSQPATISGATRSPVSNMHVVDEGKYDKRSKKSNQKLAKGASISLASSVGDLLTGGRKKDDHESNTRKIQEVNLGSDNDGNVSRQKIKELQEALAISHKRGKEWEHQATQLANEKAKLCAALSDSVQAVELWKDALQRQTEMTKKMKEKFAQVSNVFGS